MRAGLWALLGAAVGLYSGSLAWALLLSVVPYLLWHLVQLHRLVRWLSVGKLGELPEANGIWGRVFEGIYDLKRRNRKRKRRLAAMVSEFQASTAALPDAAVVINKDDEIVWFNDAARSLLKISNRDIGQRIGFLLRSPDFTRYMQIGDYDKAVELPAQDDPNVTISLRIVPYGNQQRLMIGRDVSHLRRLEQTRRDFVANASHELRTPLTVLKGYLDMMSGEGEGELQAWRAPLDEMLQQSERMERIIGDLLKLARLESSHTDVPEEAVNMADLLRELEQEAREISRGRHTLAFSLEDRTPMLGRRAELYSALSNLVFNALQYTPDGGEVRVRWWLDRQGAHFAVTDTGIGIAARDLPRLTERFYRVDVARSRETGGTGLGLAIVKHAVERHDGVLEIDSRIGVGSTFSCHFPRLRLVTEAA